MLAGLEVDDDFSAPVVSWMEEWAYPSKVTASLTGATLAFAGRLFGKPVNADSVRQVVREGTILERPGDGCQVQVQSLDGLSATVLPYGGTIATDDAEPTDWDIITEVWSDYRDASNARALDRTIREVGTQIFAETFEIPRTREHTRYEVVPFEVEHQVAAFLGKLRRHLAYAVLRSRPFHDGSGFAWGNKTEEPTMCGLCSWPAITQSESPNPGVYVNKGGDALTKAGDALTKAGLDGLIRRLWPDQHADYNTGDWRIVCHPQTHEFIHDFDMSYRRIERDELAVGFHVDEFHSKVGKTFPITPEPLIRPGVVLLVNLQAFTYGYYAGDSLESVELDTQGRYRRWLITFQTYGVVARNPRSNIGMMYGISG